MKEQNYKNHRRLVPLFHIGISLLLIALYTLSINHLIKTIKHDGDVPTALIPLIATVTTTLISWYSRSFAATVQDRVIRSEENIRHYLRTGKPLSPQLSMRQIIALRFASDEEYDQLADRAIRENLSSKQIKKTIRHWKADHHRI